MSVVSSLLMKLAPFMPAGVCGQLESSKKFLYDYDCQLSIKHRNLLRVAMIQFRAHVGFVCFLRLGCPPLVVLMRFRRDPISRGRATQLRHEPQAEAQNLRRSDQATPVSEAEVSARGVRRSFPNVRAWR